VKRRYDECSAHLEKVAKIVRETVLTFCEKRGFAYVGRTKMLESLAEKIESGRYRKWSEIDDLFGCAVVIPTLAEEDSVLEFLNSLFVQVVIRKRGTTLKSPDVFRFEATRFYGRLRPTGADSDD